MRVAFLAPNCGVHGNFYEVFTDFLRVAAQQLGIDLEVVDGTKQREVMLERGREIAARATRPDYLLLVNYMNVAPELLPVFTAAGVGTFLVVEGMGSGERLAMRRKAGSGCLGELVPDDVEAGRMLADILVSEARRRGLANAEGQVHVGVLAGEQTQAGSSRFRGWQAFKKERSDIVQAGFQYGSWEENEGRAAATLLLKTAPDTNVLWCANDAMALGSVSAAVAMGRKPGEKIVIGGIDLLQRALAEILAGTMHVSIGGHLVDGVRALLLLDDHHQGRGLTSATRTTHLVAVTANDAERYLRFMKNRAWHNVDFTRFSARRTPGGVHDELSLHSLVAS